MQSLKTIVYQRPSVLNLPIPLLVQLYHFQFPRRTYQRNCHLWTSMVYHLLVFHVRDSIIPMRHYLFVLQLGLYVSIYTPSNNNNTMYFKKRMINFTVTSYHIFDLIYFFYNNLMHETLQNIILYNFGCYQNFVIVFVVYHYQ